MYIVDTSVILSGFIPDNLDDYITVEEVLHELKKSIYHAKMLKICSPSKKSIKKIEEFVKESGDDLSVTDFFPFINFFNAFCCDAAELYP